MSRWWSPKTWLRVKELEMLNKQVTLLQAKGLPVPAALQMKVNELQAKLSG